MVRMLHVSSCGCEIAAQVPGKEGEEEEEVAGKKKKKKKS